MPSVFSCEGCLQVNIIIGVLVNITNSIHLGTAHYLSGVWAWKYFQKNIKKVLVPSEKHDKKVFAPYTTAAKKVCVPYAEEIFSFISMVKYYYYLKH